MKSHFVKMLLHKLLLLLLLLLAAAAAAAALVSGTLCLLYYQLPDKMKLQWNLPEQPGLLSDYLTKILIGSIISQFCYFKMNLPIGDTSHKRPPKPDIKGGRLWEVPLNIICKQKPKQKLFTKKSSEHLPQFLTTVDTGLQKSS